MECNTIINKSCFTPQDRENYNIYRKKIGDITYKAAEEYMNGEATLNEIKERIYSAEDVGVHEYTFDLFLVLDCTALLEEIYKQKGIDAKYFDCMVSDIKSKLDECSVAKNIFGIFVLPWYDGFFRLTRFALGRLQYDITEFNYEDVTINDYTLKKGDFVLNCHIPSGSPLDKDLCADSFKAAYKFFGDKIKNGILPVMCRSWLLYPPYATVFHKKSNLADFRKNFHIFKVFEADNFGESWRVFGKKFTGDISVLPSTTTLQKNFIQFLKTATVFGDGGGLMLYDGKEILTRKD